MEQSFKIPDTETRFLRACRRISPSYTPKAELKGHTASLAQVKPMYLLMYLPYNRLNDLSKAIESDTPLKDPVSLNLYDHSSEACTFCKSNDYTFDGFTITAERECPYPKGLDLSVDISIPSGRMLCGNDFRSAFSHGWEDNYDINSFHGIYETVKAYAKSDMAHFFVGNSCPSLYRTDKDQFKIGNEGSLYKDQKEIITEISDTNLGWICTDLWWVSIADAEKAKELGYKKREDDFEVKVSPGIYTLKYHYLRLNFKPDDLRKQGKPVVYADLKLKSLL